MTRGGDVTARTTLKGKSPLHIAAGHAETRAVQELVLRWGADETQLDGRGRSASDIAGALKNVFDRGHRHAEQVERIKVVLASAPADRRWIRRRAVVMLVSRLRGEITRQRSKQSEKESNNSAGAKKRGGGTGATEGAAEAAPKAAAAAAAEAGAAEAGAVEVVELDKDALVGGEGNGNSSLENIAGGGAAVTGGERRASSLPNGMEPFRDAVIRLAGEDDEGVFRSVVGFL